MSAVPRGSQEIRLRYTRPFEWQAMLGFFRARAVAGVEDVGEDVYARTIALPGGAGRLAMRDDPAAGELVATVLSDHPVAAATVEARLRRSLDLDADLPAVARHFAGDTTLAALVAARPFVRIPGFWDPFETAIRAVLGQQVSLSAARVLAGRLVERAGARIGGLAPDSRLGRVFPGPEQILAADLGAMGMPGARVRTLQAIAAAVLAEPDLFRRAATLDATLARLRAIKGVGDWTAHYIALRACREPDAFPAGDIGLLRGMAVDGRRPTAAELAARAESWRPFRAYAAHHIWASDAGPVAETPADGPASAARQ